MGSRTSLNIRSNQPRHSDGRTRAHVMRGGALRSPPAPEAPPTAPARLSTELSGSRRLTEAIARMGWLFGGATVWNRSCYATSRPTAHLYP
jgi:hypothetical protein